MKYLKKFENFDEEMLEFSKEVEMDLDNILSPRDPQNENSNTNNINYNNADSVGGNADNNSGTCFCFFFLHGGRTHVTRGNGAK